jgi:hypothetical protein
MSRKFLSVLAYALAAVAVGILVGFLPNVIRSQGADTVQAFASVISLLALLAAAGATIMYVQRTAQIAKATEESSRQQARLVDLMERDLKFRVEPYPKYVPQFSSAPVQRGIIKNEGRGTAVNLRVRFTFVGSGRQGELRVPDLLAPGEETAFQLIREHNEDAYTIEVTCTDSASLNNYSFKWTNDGSLESWKAEHRSRTQLASIA